MNVTDGGAPFYNVYRCVDGKYVSVAPVGLRFFRELLQRLDIHTVQFPDRLDRAGWQHMQAVLADRFAKRTRAQWCELLEGTDCCFAPVLSMPDNPGDAIADVPAGREHAVERPRPGRGIRSSPAA
jgi:crotonobetainyl-CoA:carnitine CoA-transferase CaiB-like acyl-CoA transferase